MLTKVISGGQSGADFAGLLAAKVFNIPTGGWCPKGYKTENGPNFCLKDFGLLETPEPEYKTRTQWNVRDSDGTLIVAADFSSFGTGLTKKYCREQGKPYFPVRFHQPVAENIRDIGYEVISWLIKENIDVLNVAGNRESVAPGIQNWTTRLFLYVFHVLKEAEKE